MSSQKKKCFRKICKENQNTPFTFNSFFFFRKILPVYEMWKNILESSRPQRIRRMRTTRWLPKATNTHSEYAIGISLTLQQCVARRRPSVTLTYIDCLVFPSWFFTVKVARTFTNIISSPPTFHNNPLRYRRIPVRIVCSLAIPSPPTPPFFAL